MWTSEGHSSGTVQKETRLEEAKGRVTRSVMEMAIKDRTFKKNRCEVKTEKEKRL